MDVKTLPDNYVPHIAPTLDPHAIMESISLILNSGSCPRIPNHLRPAICQSTGH